MATLFDIFKFNNLPYVELTDELGKNEIESWVDKLKDTDIANQILTDYPDGCINIRTFGRADEGENYIVEVIPKDLFAKVLKIVYP